jgi:hypothetical protein
VVVDVWWGAACPHHLCVAAVQLLSPPEKAFVMQLFL